MLLENYFEKKIDQYNLLIKKRAYLRSITSLYNMYGVALAVLKIKDENYSAKRRLWKRLLNANNKEDENKYYAKFEKYIVIDFEIVLKAHEKLKDMKNDPDNIEEGNLNKLGVCAIVSYSHPSNYT